MKNLKLATLTICMAALVSACSKSEDSKKNNDDGAVANGGLCTQSTIDLINKINSNASSDQQIAESCDELVRSLGSDRSCKAVKTTTQEETQVGYSDVKVRCEAAKKRLNPAPIEPEPQTHASGKPTGISADGSCTTETLSAANVLLNTANSIAEVDQQCGKLSSLLGAESCKVKGAQGNASLDMQILAPYCKPVSVSAEEKSSAILENGDCGLSILKAIDEIINYSKLFQDDSRLVYIKATQLQCTKLTQLLDGKSCNLAEGAEKIVIPGTTGLTELCRAAQEVK